LISIYDFQDAKIRKNGMRHPGHLKKTSHAPISAITFSDRKQALLSKLFTPKSEVL
jgi:hypothetical protein